MVKNTLITPSGMDQGNLVRLLTLLTAAVDELRTQSTSGNTAVAELQTNFAALNAKLDADAGVTDVNYASTLDPVAAAPVALAATAPASAYDTTKNTITVTA